jgi:hypothetical protein
MKENPLLGIDVLLGVDNVAAVAEHEIGNTGDQAFLVGTVDEKDGSFVGHAFPFALNTPGTASNLWMIRGFSVLRKIFSAEWEITPTRKYMTAG